MVHAVEESAFFVAPLARLRRIPYIVDMDSLISHQLAYSGFVRWRPLLKVVEAMERGVVKKAAKVITVCQALTDAAARLAPTALIESRYGLDRFRKQIQGVYEEVFA